MRPQAWVIEEREDNTYSVLRAGKLIATGLRSTANAVAFVRARHRPGERIYHAEPDGYRNEITAQIVGPRATPAVTHLSTADYWRLRTARLRKARHEREEPGSS
jgi:hypothetical protein